MQRGVRFLAQGYAAVADGGGLEIAQYRLDALGSGGRLEFDLLEELVDQIEDPIEPGKVRGAHLQP